MLAHIVEVSMHQGLLASLSNSTCILPSTVNDHWYTPPETTLLKANIPLAKRNHAIPGDLLSIGRHSASLACTIRDVLIKHHVPTGGIEVPDRCRLSSSRFARDFAVKEEVYAFLYSFSGTQVISWPPVLSVS